jgi:hypothetical protein
MNITEFLTSLNDSERAFVAAAAAEIASGYHADDTMERKYEEGFNDGMRHAYTLLTGDAVPCQHDNYSESPAVCSEHGDDAECWEMICDNCDQVQLHETGENGQTPKAGRVITL